MPKTGSAPLPYKKTARRSRTSRYVDSERRHPRRDGRRGAGRAREVRAGRRHADHRRIDGDDLPGVWHHHRRHRRGAGARCSCAGRSCARKITDMKSPIAYGYGSTDLPVYFNQSPVLNAGAAAGSAGSAAAGAAARRDEPERRHRPERDAERGAAAHSAVRGRHQRGAVRRAASVRRPTTWRSSGRWRSSSASRSTTPRPRVVMQFSAESERHAAVGHACSTVSSSPTARRRSTHPLGKGHVVMFAIRPFWRWQTQGTYTLGFNAISELERSDAGNSRPHHDPRTSQPASVSRSVVRFSDVIGVGYIEETAAAAVESSQLSPRSRLCR